MLFDNESGDKGAASLARTLESNHSINTLNQLEIAVRSTLTTALERYTESTLKLTGKQKYSHMYFRSCQLN